MDDRVDSSDGKSESLKNQLSTENCIYNVIPKIITDFKIV